ncbi:MAG: hypothetical protein J5795_07230 [Lachnospiraceae bacterium]|nr:hypothetical protein [Lachnospiraceae bacterium]
MSFFDKKKGVILLGCAAAVGLTVWLLFALGVFGKKEKKADYEEFAVPEECVLPDVPEGKVLLVRLANEYRTLDDGTRYPVLLRKYSDDGCLMKEIRFDDSGTELGTYEYTYNDRRAVTSVTYTKAGEENPAGHVKITYNERGIITFREYKNMDTTYEYSENGGVLGLEKMEFDGDGKPLRSETYWSDSDYPSVTEYRYDEQNRLIRTDGNGFDNEQFEVTYLYKGDSVKPYLERRVTRNYEGTYVREYYTDPDGKLRKVRSFHDGKPIEETDYTGDRLVRERRVVDEDGNWYVAERNEYDRDYRHLRRDVYLNTGETSNSSVYEYDEGGNLMKKTDYHFGEYESVTEYSYVTLADSTEKVREEIVRDQMGNITYGIRREFSPEGKILKRVLYGDNGEVYDTRVYTYDANGNVVKMKAESSFVVDDVAEQWVSETEYRYAAFAVPEDLLTAEEKSVMEYGEPDMGWKLENWY